MALPRAQKGAERHRGRRTRAASDRRLGAGAWYPPRVSDAPWTRLAAAFRVSDVAWTVVAVEEPGDAAIVTPRLRSEALRARLDEVCGLEGWSLAFQPFAAGAVGCTLSIAQVRKSAVVDAVPLGAAATADSAFADAAALFGLVPPLAAQARRVAFDPEARVPLHDPPLDGLEATEVGSRAEARDAAETGAERGGAASPEGAPPAVAADTLGAADLQVEGVLARGLAPEALRMIDRLVERLKQEGHGLAAARLLNRYGGYGKDAAAARELYGELRSLLVRELGGVDA